MAQIRPQWSELAVQPTLRSQADYPVRDYIAAMSRELAQMAEWDGDAALGEALTRAADMAERPR